MHRRSDMLGTLYVQYLLQEPDNAARSSLFITPSGPRQQHGSMATILQHKLVMGSVGTFTYSKRKHNDYSSYVKRSRLKRVHL